MKITEEVNDRIDEIAASTFLAEGTYADLLVAVANNEPGNVTLWAPFEHDDYLKVQGYVDNLANEIRELITSL
jgi:hypothetical protein